MDEAGFINLVNKYIRDRIETDSAISAAMTRDRKNFIRKKGNTASLPRRSRGRLR